MGRTEPTPAPPASLSAFLAWLDAAPAGTTLSAVSVREALARLVPDTHAPMPGAAPTGAPETTWRERLWTVPPETRLGVLEVAEAIGRPKSFVYRHTQQGAGSSRLPHRKLDGELSFVASELRAWLRENEETMHHAPLTLSRRAAS